MPSTPLRRGGLAAVLCLSVTACGDPDPSRLRATGLSVAPPTIAAELPSPRADADLRREPGRLKKQSLFFSPTFASADGAYDLVIHFHGAPPVVKAAFRRSKLPAVVLLANFGVGSTAYQRPFLQAHALSSWLDAVNTELAHRGLDAPRRRRLALSAWSAGYGAIFQILSRSDARENVEAIVLLDGLHSHRDGASLATAPLRPFADYGRRAQEGDALFLITHSRVVPEKATTASTYRCADWLLRELDVHRVGRFELVDTIDDAPSAPPMRLESEARDRGFIVRGYAGDEPADHMAHLRQMGALGLAELARWWSPSDARDGALDRP